MPTEGTRENSNDPNLPYRPVVPYRPNKPVNFVPSQGYEKYRSPGLHRDYEIRRAMVRLRTTDPLRAEEYLGISSAQAAPVAVPVGQDEPVVQPLPAPAASTKTAKASKPRVYGVPVENINDTYRVVDKHSAKYSDKQKRYELEQWKSGKGKGRSVRDPATPSALGGLVRLGQSIGSGDVDPQAGEAFKKIADAYSPMTSRKAASERITEGEDWWVERYGRGNNPYRRGNK